jgi:hypothetical protein
MDFFTNRLIPKTGKDIPAFFGSIWQVEKNENVE